MKSWAIGGVDLHLQVDRGRGVRAGLEHALRDAIRERRLPPGARLPAYRVLAADLGIARNTVADVYGQLVAEGYLTGRPGLGTFVTGAGAAGDCPPPLQVEPPAPPIRHDLRPGRPDVSLFPRAAWLRATRRVLASAPHDVLGYGDPRGRLELRQALTVYLARARGVHADAEHIVVCAGHMQAVGLLSRAFVQRGGTLAAVESPGLPYLPTVVRRQGLDVVPLPVDEAGARTDQLTATGAAAAFLTPAHQYPLGVVLAPSRRAAAVDWARTTGGVVVEDDYDGEFRFDRQPVGAVQAHAPDHVAYVGTASKSLAPALRLAWAVVPPPLLELVVEEKRYADSQSPAIDQLVLADLLGSGEFDRQVRRARHHYRRRRERLVALLAACVPAARVIGLPAGLQAVVVLPPGVAAGTLVEAAAARGLALVALSQGAGMEALVVGYATPPEHAFDAALGELAALLARRPPVTT